MERRKLATGNNIGELIDETLEIFEIHGGEDYSWGIFAIDAPEKAWWGNVFN